MPVFPLAGGMLAAAVTALYGWGWGVSRFTRSGRLPWATLPALGFLACLWAGGVLNALRIAYALALDALFAGGLLLAAAAAWGAHREVPVPERLRRAAADLKTPARIAEAAPAALAVTFTGLLAATVLPGGGFNVHDDIQKYFIYPYRMLGTGSLGGNPYDTLGVFSLGGQGFFQGFIAAHFPATYLHAFDNLLCLLLAALLLDAAGRAAGAHWGVRCAALAALGLIDPLIVNISTVYSGTLITAAALYLAARLWDRMADQPRHAFAAALPLGACVAAYPVFKVTYLTFAAPWLAGFLLLAAAVPGTRPGFARATGGIAAGSLFMLLPWMYATSGGMPRFVLDTLAAKGHRFLARWTGAATTETASAIGGAPPAAAGGVPATAAAVPPPGTEILFTTRMFYAPYTFAHYTLAVAALCGLGALAAWMMRKRGPGRGSGWLAATSCGAVAGAIAYLAGPLIFPPGQGIRYFVPVLTATLPMIMMATAASGGPRLRAGVVAAVWVSLSLFVVTTPARAHRLTTLRHQLVFPWTPYIGWVYRRTQSPALIRAARNAQASAPRGTTILCLIETPYALDFHRNRILPMPDPPFAVRHSGISIGQGPEQLRNDLIGQGINYVMWTYNGKAMRQPKELAAQARQRNYADLARNQLLFNRVLAELAQTSDPVYDDRQTVVFRVSPAEPAVPAR